MEGKEGESNSGSLLEGSEDKADMEDSLEKVLWFVVRKLCLLYGVF